MSGEKLPGGSEHNTQSAFVEWCATKEVRYPCLRFSYAIPNGARTSIGIARKLKKEGLRKGAPDWCLPYPSGEYHGLYIEFKHGKNKLSDEQAAFTEFLTSCGYCVAVCYSVDEGMRAVERYLSGSSVMISGVAILNAGAGYRA